MHNYVEEYDATISSFSLWAIVNILHSLKESNTNLYDFYEEYIDSYPVFIELHNCAINNTEHNNLTYIDNIVLCSRNNSMILSYMHISNDVDREVFIDNIDTNNISINEMFHYNYFKNNEYGEYILLYDDLSIIDIYYIMTIKDININNYSHIVNNILDRYDRIKTIRNSKDSYYFIFSIYYLFNIENDNMVYDISYNIDNISMLPVSNITYSILNYISFSSFITGYYLYDIDIYRNYILPITRYLSDEIKTRALFEYSSTLFRLGNTSHSLKIFEDIYNNKINLLEEAHKSALINNLAVAYLHHGYLDKYVYLQLDALSLAYLNFNDTQIHYYLNNLYIYHRRLRDWNKAKDYLNEVYTSALEKNMPETVARSLLAHGTFYRDHLNDYENSLSYLYNSLDKLLLSDNYNLRNRVYQEIAATYLSANNQEKALFYYYKSIQLSIEKNDIELIIYNYVQLAFIYYNNADYNNTIKYYNKIQEYDYNNIFFRTRVSIANIESVVNIIHNNYNEAIINYNYYAKEIVQRSINSSDIQSGFIFLESEYLDLFENYLSILFKRSFYQDAIQWMDEIKNLSSFSFYNNPALKSSILTEDELVLDYALRNRIERLRGQLRTASDNQRIQINNSLIEAISKQNSLRRKVFQNIDLEPVDLNQIRRKLGRSDAILYFSLLHNDLYISTITSGSLEMSRLSFTDKDLKRIEDIVNSLSTDRVRLTEMEWLKNLLFDSINIPDRITNLFIIPDGFLYHIPFEILPISKVSSDYSYGNTSYLIENKAISYANSLKDLEMSFKTKPIRSYEYDFIGFGISNFDNKEAQLQTGKILPPLPLAEIEVRQISDALSESLNKNYFLSHNSNESTFRNKAGSSRILHLATHSEVFESDPLYSLIYMNSDTISSIHDSYKNDGLIYAYELFQMDLSSEMVMLNSCESGSGNYIQGSGIVGFSRAFNYAGARSLIMNLWSVRDKTAYELSLSFYSYLNQGLSKSEAMRRAKIEYINNRNSNPTYWGSFVVYGNSDPIFPASRTWTTSILVLIIAMISLFFAWLYVPTWKNNNSRNSRLGSSRANQA